MTMEFIKEMVEGGNDFYFTYAGARAGAETTVREGAFTYTFWWKDVYKKFSDWDELISAPLLQGSCIKDLVEQKLVDVEFV